MHYTYNSAYIFPLHRFVIRYGHIRVPLVALMGSYNAFLHSNCFLLHTPKGKTSDLNFSGIILHLAITSGTLLPSQGTIL